MAIAPSQRLKLRLPGWCKAPCVTVNGAALDLASLVEGGYVGISRTWQDGDVVVPPNTAHRSQGCALRAALCGIILSK
jgi:uncharacterized protein